MYVLKNKKGFVAVPGNAKSYTRKFAEVRFYKTKEAAEKDACEDDTAVHWVLVQGQFRT